MEMLIKLCPLCKRGDALSRAWPLNGRFYRNCFGLNRPEHPGRTHTFDADTGEPLRLMDGTCVRIARLLQAGRPHDLRGFPGEWLYDHCGVTVVSAKDLKAATASTMPALGNWARLQEADGRVISQIPVMRGSKLVGLQLRAFHEGDE